MSTALRELSGSTLAYMGDCVFSMVVRRDLILNGYGRGRDLQKLSIRFVSAKAQAHYFHRLEEEGWFTEEEMEIFHRGRNAKSGCVPKNTDVLTYRISTGFEALFGYWYLNQDWERVEQTWNKIRTLHEEEYGTMDIREKHG